MLGRIAAIYSDEGKLVSKGQLLAELDSSDILAQKDQAFALKDQAMTNMRQVEIKYASDQQSLRVVEINSERAREDFDRASKQFEGGVITQEQFDHIRKTYEAASAQVDASKAMLSVSKAQIASAAAAVETANAQIKVLETQLRNTKLYSPDDGVISRRWLLPGDIIQPGQSLFTLTDDKEKWILVFLEETKISEIRDGQKVKFTNNASGNFTKVTQRIPLKISIDSTDTGRNISSYNILAGMSAVVKIIRK
jgi:membrane fusion protein (multidrug efflux system)